MTSIGIICEYNPFHNGHLYQIQTIKKMFPNSTIICVMGGNFLQRGEISIINKWDKTKIALNYGIDLVIELPFVFSSQSSDIFAKGAINILNGLKVDKIVFGSELNDVDVLTKLAKIQLDNEDYDNKVKEYLDQGINYPTALSKALNLYSDIKIDQPNDLLGLSYIKELIRIKSKITPISIKRTNDYHDIKLDKKIVSASAIRNAIKDNIDIKDYVPELSYKYINKNQDNYFLLLKYKILETKDLSIYQTVDEGIEHRIEKYISTSNSLDELIKNIKTKRYTYNKIHRMLTHILCSFTKQEASNNNVEYIRVLGFNQKGQHYLNKIKKETTIPIITSYSNIDSEMLNLENRVNKIYSLIVNNNELIEQEKKGPIIK